MKIKKLLLSITAFVLVIALSASGMMLIWTLGGKNNTVVQLPVPVDKIETYAELVEHTKKELENIQNLNGGALPIIALDSQTYVPNFILGTYSSKKVSSVASALKSLQDVKVLMGIEDVDKEYKRGTSVTIGDTTQYRLQQMYGKYEVYGQQLVVTADAAGNVTSLSGDHVTIGSMFDNSVAISESDARTKAGVSASVQASVELVAYTLDGYQEMAYVVQTEEHTTIVSAKDGEILSEEYRIETGVPTDKGTVTQTIGRDETNSANNTFNTAYFDYEDASKPDTYIFYDGVRNIVYHDRQMINREDWYDMANMLPLQDNDNIWTSDGAEKAVVLYRNLSNTYDFYLNVLGLMSFDGNGGQILAFVNDGYDNGNNAFNWGPRFVDLNKNDNEPAQSVTILSFGGVKNYQNSLDVVAHEFTHAVEGGLVPGVQYSGQSGALMEAYSDAMGELIQAYYSDNGQTDWIHGERNMKKPGSVYDRKRFMKYPQKYNGAGYYTGSGDNGGVHHNSTVISHAIYEIYNSGLRDIPTMAELLYRSWGYLTPDASFYDYRMAMLASAQVMGLDAATMGWINKAFDDADITPDTLPDDYERYLFESAQADWVLMDAQTKAPVAGVEITAYSVTDDGLMVAKAYTDENGKASFGLRAGAYRVVVSATGYRTETFYQGFKPFERQQITYLLQKADYQEGEVYCELGGVTTNAVDGMALPEVTMVFRKGYMVTSGSAELVLISDSEGKFNTRDLDYGYYTIELQKDGYITSYVVAQAAASNWESNIREDALNQNYSISPMLQVDDALRIVLTWGANPRDLDSHLIGPLDDDSRFHVYYSSKNAYEDGERVVVLDVDDTTSYGPETITVNTVNERDLYHYYVHDYTNRKKTGNTALAASGAKVQVFSGSRLIAVYNVPVDQVGTVWHVFDYDPVEGKLIPVNAFGYESLMD